MNEYPEQFIYYVIRIKDSPEYPKFVVKWDEQKNEIKEFEDLEKENNYITRIYYFKKPESKNYLSLSFGNQSSELNLMGKNFIFDDYKISFSNIEMSLYEKFKAYKMFIEKKSSSSPKIRDLFYEDCYKLCLKTPIDFLIFIETLIHYKSNDEKVNKLFLHLADSSEFYNLNIETLRNSGRDYIEIIENLSKNQNLEKKKENGIEIVLMILYICLSYEDKFTNFYENSKKQNKKNVCQILNKIQSVEELFINKNLGKRIQESHDKKEVKDLLYSCNYFSNLIYLLSFYIKNPKKIQVDLSKNSYKILNEDNLELIISRYEEIKNQVPSVIISQNHWDNYRNIYKSHLNLKKLLLLHKVLNNQTEFFEAINYVIQEYLETSPSSLEICEFIQKFLTSNLDWIKGKFTVILGKYFNLKNLSNDEIEEFKKCKLKELCGEKIYIKQFESLISSADNLSIMEKTLKLFDFDYINNEEEKKKFYPTIDFIIDEIVKKCKKYEENEYQSLFNIINFILFKMNTNQISELINLMQKNIPFKYLIDIFIKMLNDNTINNAEINNKIITFLLKKCITNNKIDYLITKITNKEKMKIILNQKDLKSKEFSIPSPTIKDFLLNEDSKSIIILKRFIEVGKFENFEFINEGYGK